MVLCKGCKVWFSYRIKLMQNSTVCFQLVQLLTKQDCVWKSLILLTGTQYTILEPKISSFRAQAVSDVVGTNHTRSRQSQPGFCER
jgi:hypothetical protein